MLRDNFWLEHELLEFLWLGENLFLTRKASKRHRVRWLQI
jgi:hypothetical protein